MERSREILAADLARELGLAPEERISEALGECLASGVPLADALGLGQDDRARLDAAVAARREPAVRLRRVAPDRYREFEPIGKGGMGVVYLALDTELNRRVAFKMVVPDPKAARSTPAPDAPLQVAPPTVDPESERSFEEFRLRFLQEAWVTGGMEHPGIVPVYELGETEGGIPYYTMRYVKGERTLAQAMKGAKDLDARLALLEPFLRVCDTISYAHSHGVVHRDLKPENIALGGFGETIVLDWGLAKTKGRPDVSAVRWRARIEQLREAGDLRTAAAALGTPGYMAPEAVLGESEQVDERSDLYSLGTILFEILTGRLPFPIGTFGEYATAVVRDDPPKAHEADPGVPRELSRVCAQATARRKEDRLGTVAELAAELRRWQTEGTIDREVAALVDAARDELAAAPGLTGNVLLWHLDRALGHCNRAIHLRQSEEALRLQGEIKKLRERGIRERLRGDRRSLLQKMGVLVLVLAAVATAVVAHVLEGQRADEEATRLAAEERIREARAEAQERAGTARAEAAAARRRERARLEEFARGYAALGARHLQRGETARARVAAARALFLVADAPPPECWKAMADADAAWAPTLRALLPGVAPTALAFGPAGTLYWTGRDLLLREADAATGKVLRTLRGLPAPATVLCVSADGARVVAGTERGHLVLWDRVTGNLLGTIPEGPAGPGPAAAVTALALSADGREARAGHQDLLVRVWDLERRAPVRLLSEHKAPVTAIAASGERLYSGDRSGNVYAWDRDGLFASDVFAWVPSPIAGIEVSEDGESLFTWNLRGQVRMWDVPEHKPFSVLDPQAPEAAAVLLAAGRTRLCTASDDGVLRLWDVPEGRLLGVWGGSDGRPAPLALSPDGALLAVATPAPALRVWDLAMAADDAPGPVAVSSSGATYRARPDHTIEARGARWAGHTAAITAFALDPTERRLLSASLDGTVRLWDAATGSKQGVVAGFDSPVTAVAFAGGTRLLAGTLDGRVQLHDWEAKRSVALASLAAPVCALASGPGHTYAAALDGSVRCWPADRALSAEGRVSLMAASPDGSRVAYSAGGQVRRWDPVAGRVEPVGVAEEDEPVALWWAGPDEVAWYGRDGRHRRWSDREDETRAVGEAAFGPIPVRPVPWILRSAKERLMDAEARSGLMVSGLEVVPVPPERFEERNARDEPWSD